MTHERKALGAEGERLALALLKRKGYRIREVNWSCKTGEIDIVAERKGFIVFVEVKTRYDHRFGTPLEAVTPHKQGQVRKAAQWYLVQHQPVSRWRRVPLQPRFDVIGITMKGEEPEIEHIENAFGG